MQKRTVVSLLTAAVQVLLAVNAVTGKSLVIDRFASIEVTPETVAGVLLAGALLLVIFRNWLMFILASLPYVLYVFMAIWIVYERGGGLGTAVVYSFSLLQMYLLYFCEDRDD